MDESVGPYRIVRRLGAGAMGVVYLAEDDRLARRVALKTISSEHSPTSEARDRLEREARALAQISHPNVAAVYDIVKTSDSVHIVMEYVEGETLAARIRRGPLPLSEGLTIGVQLAQAVAKAHGEGIIHRDLKPSNIMLTPGGQAKILDFGLARLMTGFEDASFTGPRSHVRRVAGTPGYIAPEIYQDHSPDGPTDIYSLGVTLFEMFTGNRPFVPGLRGGAAAFAGPMPRIAGVDASVPRELDAVVARAMAPRREERYSSADQLARALTGMLAHAAADAESVTESTVARRAPLPRLWPSATLVVAVLAAVFTAVKSPTRIAESAHPLGFVVTVLPLASPAGDEASADLAVGIADVLISTLGQLPGVTMVSRDATLPHRNRQMSSAAIATALGADLVVDGVVQRSRDAVRVSLTLQRPGSNLVAWSRTYDGTLEHVFTLQSEVASALSEALQLTLTPAQKRRIARLPTTNAEAMADYVQGRSFLERRDLSGNLEHGIKLLQSAITKDARFGRAHAALGQAFWWRFKETHANEDAERAVLETTEALRLDPEDASARQALAVVYDGRGRKEEAIEELRRAIVLQPGNDEAHGLLGQLLFESGHRDEGLAELKQAVTLRPNFWAHHYALGVAHFDAGRYPEALTAFQRVIELQPDSSRGHLMLGTTYLAKGDSTNAIATLQRALAISSDAAVYTNLGAALSAAGRHAEAAHAFEEAARLAPRSPIKHRNLGDAYARVGRLAEAKKAYTRAAELCQDDLRTNPRDARALSMLAVYQAKLERHAEAARHASEAVALAPRMADVVYRQAVVFALGGRVEESLTALETAFRLGYSRKMAGDDEDLKVLRERMAFKRLVAGSETAPQKGGGT